MSQPVTASFVFEPNYLAAGFRWHLRAMSKQRRFFRILSRVVIWLIGLLALAGLIFLPQSTKPAGNWSLWILISLPLMLYLFDWLPALLFRRSITQSPSIGRMFQYTFDEQGLTTHTDGADGKVTWEFVYESVTTPDGVLIYMRKGIFHWLALNAFSSETGLVDLTALLATRTKHRCIK